VPTVADLPPRAARGPSIEWWYLGYLGVMLFQPTFDPAATGFDWAVLGATWAVFVPAYVLAARHPDRMREFAVGTLVLACAVLPFNGGAGVLVVFAAAFVASQAPRHETVRWLVGMTVLLLGFAVAADLPVTFAAISYGPSAVFVWVVGLAAHGDAERLREASALRVENARVRHLATVSERERIARDLHDLLGHTLTSVVVRAQLVQRLAEVDPARAATEAREIEAAAREALTEVRGTVQGWRQASLDDELAVARTALAAAEVELTVDRDPSLVLAPSIEAALALALREGVTNVVRHAGARRCTVSVGQEGDEVTLRIADDGRGGGAAEGGGLSGMRERMSAIGGRVDRAARAGTTLTVAVPAEVAG
jgi:two-component system, NarL family, sensor histidine kinase DesK